MLFFPEGRGIPAPTDMNDLMRAVAEKRICEATAMLCDKEHNIIVDLGFIKGIIPREEGAFSPLGNIKDIAVISRVGKPVCFTILKVAEDISGKPYALLSRREAMQLCYKNFISRLSRGDVISGRITRPDSFGAFVDIGCGNVALIPIDAISVSRISHSSDRFRIGQDIRAVVSDISPDGRISLSHKELLGSWEENVRSFEMGQTVSGIVRSVEEYGVFIELTPNLAGLAEPSLIGEVGDAVSVYIKSIIPEKMKIKLVIIDKIPLSSTASVFKYPSCDHIEHWRYSPESCPRVIESRF